MNKLEQDIELLERIDIKHFLSGSIEQSNYIVSKADEANKAIEHILSDYKRVLKENEEKTTILLAGAEKVKQLEEENKELKADNYELNNRITDLLENIPAKKIKDKIKELKKKVEELTDDKGYWGGSDLLEQIKVLQELLDNRK